MKKFNEEKFMADYELALKKKEDVLKEKDAFIEAKKAEVEALRNPNGMPYSENVKEILLNGLIAEEGANFEVGAIEAEIEMFEKYLDEIEEVEEIAEESENIESQEAKVVEDIAQPETVQVDEFGNIINQ